MERKLILTEDGSHTLYIPDMDENYHSTHGAIQESRHVFIEAGFHQLNKKCIHVLEIGLGTGLNALLTLMASDETGQEVHYFGVEKYPLVPAEYQLLNYSKQARFDCSLTFQALHDAEWESAVKLTANFYLTKVLADITTLSLTEFPSFDLIYFDAFAPNKQVGIWTTEMYQKLYDACNNKAVLVTYCAQGQVRRDLQSVGFTVERIPGPPGKREMIRARKGN